MSRTLTPCIAFFAILLVFLSSAAAQTGDGEFDAEAQTDEAALDELDLDELPRLGDEVTPTGGEETTDDDTQLPNSDADDDGEVQSDDARAAAARERRRRRRELFTTVVVGSSENDNDDDGGRARSRVTRARLDERLPRSAPDALRYEPGVYIQQTAHGQASTYIRGLTGQQTLALYDGIRLNNATYRQGPNQYFFTVDSQTVAALGVMRGSASVLYGSDALGGVLTATPRDPLFLETTDGLRLTPRTRFRLTTADSEAGGRFELEAQIGQHIGFLGGVGYRSVGQLETAGIVYGVDPARDENDNLIEPEVPRLHEGETLQPGTGFNELTFDGRFVFRVSDDHRLTAAFYGYHELDSPRTDQCPAAFAPHDECLMYEEQFRDLAYLAYDANLGAAAEQLRISLSYQRQHEVKRLDRPSSFVVLRGQDDTHTAGLVARARTRLWQPLSWLALRLRYGTDFYYDWVGSSASTTFTDVDVTVDQSRGLYLDGSTYLWWGLYTELEARLPFGFRLRGGVRLAVMSANAPGDPDSESLPVDQTWVTPVGRGGLGWSPLDWLTVVFNVDQGFRAPNLDDLTSRQQTGPGFQFENANLDPERSLTLETGLEVDTRRFRAEAHVFWTQLDDAILRAPRGREECPSGTPQCQNSWNRFQLVNASEESIIYGVEAMAYARIPGGFTLRATVAYAFGEGPNPGEPPSDPEIEWEERVPLSRIPPLNGTVELRWNWREVGIFAGAGLRWALAQTRLALSDISDERIPPGGTPGYAVLELRAGYRFRRHFLISAVFENVTNEVYRIHGSSINGPARGLMVQLQASL